MIRFLWFPQPCSTLLNTVLQGPTLGWAEVCCFRKLITRGSISLIWHIKTTKISAHLIISWHNAPRLKITKYNENHKILYILKIFWYLLNMKQKYAQKLLLQTLMSWYKEVLLPVLNKLQTCVGFARRKSSALQTAGEVSALVYLSA